MTLPGYLRRLARLADDERGMALPVALFAMIAGVATASVVVMSTVEVQQGSHRDSSTKSAIAVADAGANIARARIDRYATVLATKPCLKMGSTGVLEGAVAESNGWCPAVEGTVGGGRYSYRVSPAGSTCGEYKLCVVSTGTVDQTSRRIEVAYEESAVEEEIEEKTDGEEKSGEESSGNTKQGESVGVEGLIGVDSIAINGNADVRVHIGTNGDVTAVGNADICGDIRHGVGKKFETSGNAEQCSGYQVTESNKSLPPVSSFMPSDIATNNSNYRLVKCTSTKPTPTPTGCELDTYSGGKRSSTKPWNAETRAITLEANTTLTVSGGDYWICSLSVSGNAQLIMAASAQVRFFFDTPENCNVSSGGSQISLTGNSRIASTSKTVMPAFYLLGSTTTPTSVSLGGNASTEDEFVVYGPNTSMDIHGNATYKGVIAGKSVVVTGNGKFENDASYKPPAEITPIAEVGKTEEGGSGGEPKITTVTTARYYTPQFYVECIGTAAAGAAPNANC
jgi:hypothetical protein